MVLAGGQRAGFFIGDGAGVGKGRQVRYWQISNPSNEPCPLFNDLTYNTPWYFAHIFPSPRSEEKYEQWAKIVSEYYVLTNHWMRDLFFHFYASSSLLTYILHHLKTILISSKTPANGESIAMWAYICVSFWPRN